MPTLAREIVTNWTLDGVRVATVHPTYGRIDRGRISASTYGAPERTSDHVMWHLVDFEGTDLGWFCEDYVAAQTRLLDASAWLDDIDETPETGK